ncbi:MAG: 50S ribosomal protein L29 [Deltaproteobacteria bacterium]|nr:50S ribosomal protein L29 [Deltaproteobacteria bacterium]
MKSSELRELALEELNQKETDFREELFNLNFQHAIGKLENTARLKELRRDIARVNTLRKERLAKEGSSEA